MKSATGALIPSLHGLDATARGPLHRQIYERVRAAILEGALAPGLRLPSTRTMAADLGLSRITVETAFTQLRAEGFVDRRVGAGTYVACCIPEHAKPPRTLRGKSPTSGTASRHPRGAAALSDRGRLIAGAALPPPSRDRQAFHPWMPAIDHFPHATWHRLMARRARRSGAKMLAYGEGAGYRPLRQAIATYLNTARGVRCAWEQVVVLTGAQQGLELSSRLLLDPGDEVWMEEPGYLGARMAFAAGGARLVPVPVDDEGMVVAAGLAAAPRARVAYVTPSHQLPIGVTMSLARRFALLAWAERTGSWIVEDDYDSEFRYTGRPIAAAQGLDAASRVIYLGTFNKVLFPTLRLGYLVAPPDLIESIVGARALTDGAVPLLPQATLADFMEAGYFGAHVRQMRALYHERRDALLDALHTQLGGSVAPGPADGGMHLTVYLPEGTDEAAVIARGAERGMELRSLSRHYIGQDARPGLVLGYAGATPEQLRRAVALLAELLAPPRRAARNGPTHRRLIGA